MAEQVFGPFEVFWALPVAIEIGRSTDVAEFRLETEGGFTDDSPKVRRAELVEEGVQEGKWILTAEYVEVAFVFEVGDEGLDIEVVEAVVAEGAGVELLGVELEGQSGGVCGAAAHRVLEKLVAEAAV